MSDDEAPSRTDSRKDKLIKEAKRRWKRAQDWESVARGRWLDDIKFYNGDAYNMYQWKEAALTARSWGTGDERPCLTVNKIKVHVKQVVNDARQNKTAIRIKPTGNEATYEAAQVIEGIIRHIEYVSTAQSHYIETTKFQVQAGLGYLTVDTAYVGDDTFDQEFKIGSLADPLKVYWDPDSVEADGSDARFAFQFTDMPRDEFDLQYPKYAERMGAPGAALANTDDWIAEKHVRIAGYWYRQEVKDTLIVFTDPETGEKRPIRRSETRGWPDELKAILEEQLADPDTKTRPIITHEVKWAKIVGEEIEEERDWVGTTIPMVPMFGEKTVIDGELDRKGLVRSMLDSQRMLNYNSSASIEYGALQSKTPWYAPAAAIEGNTAWENSNLINYAVLTYNHVDDQGKDIPPPQKLPPPTGAPVYQQGMENAANDMMMVSGQYQATLGQPSDEKSGKAIQERQRQGENATYDFIDNQARAIQRVGKIIIEGLAKIYDTRRIIKIMGEDGTVSDVQIDPTAKLAYEKRKAETEDAAEQVIFNPTIGKYDVMSDVGPDYATRRQEAFNALSQIARESPELMAVIGDLVLLAADFPLADQAAERLKRMVPAQALGEGVNPQVTQLQEQLATTQKLGMAMSSKLVELQNKLSSKDAQKSVDIYKAITDRIDTLMKYSNIPAVELMRFQHDLAMQEHSASMDLAGKAMDAALAPDAATDEDMAA